MNYTGVEVSLDNETVVKIGNFFIVKNGEATLTVFNITKDFELENGDISKLPSMSFTNLLPDKLILRPINLVEVGGGVSPHDSEMSGATGGPIPRVIGNGWSVGGVPAGGGTAQGSKAINGPLFYKEDHTHRGYMFTKHSDNQFNKDHVFGPGILDDGRNKD